MNFFADNFTLITIIHVFGVILGAGGAYISDAMFFLSAKDKKIGKTELKFLKLGSIVVWVGLMIILVSGLGLYLSDIEKYSVSSKFLAKMSIVGIIILNGIFFHVYHFPRLVRHAGLHFPSSSEFVKKAPLLLASGAVSFISWTSSFILGSLKIVPYTFVQIFGTYLLVIIAGIIFTIVFKKFLIPHK